MRPETIAVKAIEIDEATGALVPPIHLSTTYVRDAEYRLIADRDYTRDKNPTPLGAEHAIAALEGGARALVFSSGMAAATSLVRSLTKPGDHVLAPKVAYYALRGWFERFTTKWGIGLDFVDMTNLDAVRGALRDTTRLVWLETPANPTWDVTDIAAVAELAHRKGALVAVDSTCATPVHTRPLTLGADLVMHSATKYLGGHSDVLAGALVTREDNAAWAEIHRTRHDEGAVIGPVEAFLLGRGIRTLFARVERQSRTALSLATRLAERGVTVCYPGLPSHPQHAVAAKQMTGGFGGMLSIRVPDPLALVKKLRVWMPATSLGGVESLIEHRASVEGPTSPTPKDLLRLSVGLEHEDDLFEDLVQAL
ncbi:MAG TPA: PLP-dependent aspartate aminotransferase family protein [Kofleriaceae bacterium]|nr:PLP-dependent aspartate aminotransferase family protein [Kofleriaceae bacterium]